MKAIISQKLFPACVIVSSVYIPTPVVRPKSKFKVKFGLKVSCYLQYFWVYFYIDGKEVYKNWGFHILPGVYEHEVELTAPAEEGKHKLKVITDQEIAEGLPGKTIEFYVGTPTAGYGFLEVTSEPDGASVYINDNFIGVTPLIEKIKVGHYTLKIIKKGYEPVERMIVIAENKITRVHVKLKEISQPENRKWIYSLFAGVAGIATGILAGYAKRKGYHEIALAKAKEIIKRR